MAFAEHGFPLFAPVRQMSLLKAPFCVVPCPGQNTLQLPVPAPVQQACGIPDAVHAVLSITPDRVAVPVVSGLRAIGMSPMNVAQTPAVHVPVPAPVQHAMGTPAPVHPGLVWQFELVEQTRLLKLPRKQRWVPVTALGDGQSLDVPCAFFDTHAAPWFGLPSHTPVLGDTEPLQGAPPTDTAQIGHGCDGTPVSTVAEFS
jgi:hypothetical protein